jgi:hypothetical protein
VVTHGTTPEGLDYYCDENYQDCGIGYAFKMAAPLVDKVVKHCHLPEEMGLWKAHNFIEMAADLWLYNHFGQYRGLLAQALADRELIIELCKILAPFYDISLGKLSMSFPIYAEFVLLDEVTALGLAKKFNQQTARKHGIEIDIPGATGIIEEAVDMIDQNLPEFLQSSEEKVGALLASLRKSVSHFHSIPRNM